MAFASLRSQVLGLIGSRGILPAATWLERSRPRSGRGPRAWATRVARRPTLFWLAAGDGALRGACDAGIALSMLVVVGILPAPALLLLWLLYLSLCAVGRDFLAFQWDVLLLEAGFLSVFLAPWTPVATLPGKGPVPPIALLLLWWLLFRLVFQSGVGKLTSGDPTWRDLSALSYHWWTQPLPARPAWRAAQLPDGAQRVMTAAALFLEIPLPLLVFGPRDARLAAFAGIVLLQLLIAATGNYGFFNLLTVALALLLVDDTTWAAVLPAGLLSTARPAGAGLATAGSPLRPILTALVALPSAVVGGAHVWETVRPGARLPRPLARLLSRLAPWRTFNTYGLFRVMTRRRPELIVEGSRDGRLWEPFEFRYKPGDPSRRPRRVAPHQPRLDWQMWFESLGSFGSAAWFPSFLARLLEGSPDVRGLLARDPFGATPPRFVRTVRYAYRFPTAAERRKTGRWWNRERLGPHGPAFSLEGGNGGETGGSAVLTPRRGVPGA